jgi:geranylgeranyl pyrophosphate synthase
MIPMDFLFALQQGLAKNDEDEIYIRIHMLWAFNHRQRDNKALFQSQNDKDVFEDNLKQLLKLLDDSETSLLLKAEIYRYLSQFDKSIELLKPLKSKNETAEILINACLDRNKKLIELV